MTETKRPTTIAEQIAILKDHGCIISDSTFAEEILSTINYYRLSAYFRPFRNDDGNFLSDTTFEKIHRIYEFDRELHVFHICTGYVTVPLDILILQTLTCDITQIVF